jgi:Fe-S cluster assembly protein SufD
MTQFGSLSILGSAQPAALPESIATLQRDARTSLAGLNLPTRRTENWKYSFKRLGDLNSLVQSKQADADGHSPIVSDALVINIVNGRADQSSIVAINAANQSGLRIIRFSDLDEAQTQTVIENTRDHAQGELEQLNSALFEDAIFIEIAKNVVLSRPIQLNLVHKGSGLSTPRVFVSLGQSAQVTLIETHQVEDSESAFVANQMSALLAANSKLNYLRMNPLGNHYKLSTATRAILKRDAVFESDSLCLGAGMGRHDLHVLMTESGAHCELNGVVVTKGKQHFDNHTNIEHIASHCTSEENYRCIADDQSHIVFNGRIHIHKDAQKTLGEMNNRNLLLSNGAEIDTKPELEIYADDVKCAHGATIGQLNEKEVYYLKTRGLSDEQARQMLTLGFVLELVRAAPIEELAQQWEQSLSELLSFQDK